MSSCKEDDDGDGEARDSVEGLTDTMMEVNWSQVYVTVTAFSEDQGAPENSETTRSSNFFLNLEINMQQVNLLLRRTDRI